MLGQVGNGDQVDQKSPALVDDTIQWQQASAGGEHTCAIDTQGQLYCWGDNLFRQLGRTDVEWSTTPLTLPESP